VTTVIVRAAGERTVDECVRRLRDQVDSVRVVSAAPFAETLRLTYKLALDLKQPWTVVVDADVLIFPKMVKAGLRACVRTSHAGFFCLDGKTRDKVFLQDRRAGIHIYRTSMLWTALHAIDGKKIKPESHVRGMMKRRGSKTFAPPQLVFGLHDYEQYYRDLYRKAFVQAKKLPGHVKAAWGKWQLLSESDPDYRVLIAGAEAGRRHEGRIIPDVRIDLGADAAIEALGLTEKEPMDAPVSV